MWGGILMRSRCDANLCLCSSISAPSVIIRLCLFMYVINPLLFLFTTVKLSGSCSCVFACRCFCCFFFSGCCCVSMLSFNHKMQIAIQCMSNFTWCGPSNGYESNQYDSTRQLQPANLIGWHGKRIERQSIHADYYKSRVVTNHKRTGK